MSGIALSSLGNSSGGSGGGILSGGNWNSTDTLAGIQGGSSVLGMMSQLQMGQQQAWALNQQASDAMLNAGQAQVSGQNELTGLRQKLLSTVGARTAAAGASGVDVGQGVTAQGNRTIEQNAATTGQVDLDNADIQSKRQQINALADQYQANEDIAASQTKGLGSLLGGVFNIAKLGIGAL